MMKSGVTGTMTENREQIKCNINITIELLGRVKCEPMWRSQRHSHLFWEIIYLAKGPGNVGVHIGGSEYFLHEGNILLVAPNEPHYFFNHTTGQVVFMYVGFGFNPEALPFEGSRDHHFSVNGMDGLQMLVNCFDELSTDCESDYPVLLRSYSTAILTALQPVVEKLRSIYASDAWEASEQNIVCKKTIEYLRANLHRTVSVKELAANLYMSPHYVGNLFKAAMNQTIKQYHMQLKMEMAISRIRNSSCSISEISDDLGFTSPQYFSKRFRDYYGFLPMDIRRRRK